jgi:hypothetical protein
MALLGLVSICLLFTPALGTDDNYDGVDDSYQDLQTPILVESGTIGVVDTGNRWNDDPFILRLTGLGYGVSVIPLTSGYSTLMSYPAVVLPTSHASSCCNSTLRGLAADYIQYVNAGGCLHVSQPNPWNLPGYRSDIPWVPYHLVLDARYDFARHCPVSITDPAHCITSGLLGSELPAPGDTVISMGPEWQILTTGGPTSKPGLFVATYGKGYVVVELSHPSPGANCPFSDAALERMFACCIGAPPTATEGATWGGLKRLYR